MSDLSPTIGAVCSTILREQEKPYPRTCRVCGLGPCRERPAAKKAISPTKPGYYWAQWRIAADGTHEGDELTPSTEWEIVQVNDNGGDRQPLSVAVSGVRETQWPDCFVWGQFVAPLEKADARSFQDRVAAVHPLLFHGDPTDISERRDRFGEEAIETLQAFGMTLEELIQLARYTYGRPVGEPAKEIGSAMLTLASLCVEAGHDLIAAAEADLAKLQRPETIARIRAKRATRHGRGPLPGIDALPQKNSGGL